MAQVLFPQKRIKYTYDVWIFWCIAVAQISIVIKDSENVSSSYT